MAANLDLLVPELRDAARALVDAAARARLQPRVTSTLRSHAEQVRLYRRFLAGSGGFPVAPPGQSAHEYGQAFDMVVSPMEALADVGYTWQTWGGGWNPGDAIHFELPGATAALQKSFDLATEVGKAMGEGVNVAGPLIGSIPYVESTLKVGAEHDPYSTASLAANIYLWLANLRGDCCRK